MEKIVTLRTSTLGFVSWLVPFVASFLFFDTSGQLSIPQPLFKSLMVVIFGALGCALFVLAFRRLRASPATGLALGCYWLAINLGLDLVILVPFTKMPVVAYFYDIGLRYLLIPIFGTAIGIAARDAASRSFPPESEIDAVRNRAKT
jgi:hypothetical protein